MRRTPCNERGVSLLELMGAIAITGLILLGAMSFSSAAADTSGTASQHLLRIQNRGEVLGDLRSTFNRCLARLLPVDGTSFHYSEVIPLGLNGSFVDATGSSIWGVMEGGQPVQDRSYILSFVETEQRSERDEGFDRNFDGDMEDTFRVGFIRMSHDNGRVIKDLDLLTYVDAEDPAGDIDGDGSQDPIFSIDGLNLTVRVAYPTESGWLLSVRKHFRVTATDV